MLITTALREFRRRRRLRYVRSIADRATPLVPYNGRTVFLVVDELFETDEHDVVSFLRRCQAEGTDPIEAAQEARAIFYEVAACFPRRRDRSRYWIAVAAAGLALSCVFLVRTLSGEAPLAIAVAALCFALAGFFLVLGHQLGKR